MSKKRTILFPAILAVGLVPSIRAVPGTVADRRVLQTGTDGAPGDSTTMEIRPPKS